jgi:hypothetical protein
LGSCDLEQGLARPLVNTVTAKVEKKKRKKRRRRRRRRRRKKM